MPQNLTAEQKLHKMTHAPIPGLVFSLAVPTIISMLISAFYNMADTYFVGLIGSASATGAVGVCFPLMALLQAVGFMFGNGSGNYISRALGAQANEDAERMAATGFGLALLTGCAISLAGMLCLPSLVYWLGSTETIAPYAHDYAFWIILGAPWLVSSLVLNNQFRFQGNAFYAMIGIAAGAVLNIALDPVFIFTLKMGVAGAALATVVSQLVSFALLLGGTFRGGNIRIKLRLFSPTLHRIGEIFRGGVPSLLRQGLASVATICLNTAAGGFGDIAIAAMSIVTRITMFASSAIIGFGQGFQPLCGFNYGAKCYARVRSAFWFCVKVAFGVLIFITLAALLWAPQLVELFLKDNPQVTEIGSLALRLQCITLPVFSFVLMSNMMLQTIGMAREASLVAAARQGLFFIPAVLVLPPLLGLLGVQLAQPVSDLCSFILCVPMTLRVLNILKQKEERLAESGPDDDHAQL